MRKIVAGLFMTLDGVVDDPQEWQMPSFDEEMGAVVGRLTSGGDALLLGRRTCQEFEAAFAHQSGEPTADMMNAVPKVVVSTTLPSADWGGSTLISSDVPAEIARLKPMPGGTINMSGSATPIRSLLRDGLLDELHLLLHPVAVGHGKRLFDDIGQRASLTLADAHAFRSGVVSLTYTPAGV